MEVAVLTSSRADFGYYMPLLNLLKKQKKINARIVAFGTHLSEQHGYTINAIERSGYKVYAGVDAVPVGDTPQALAETIGLVHYRFAEFWAQHKFDLILCLGDRYEMFAAVSAAVPFGIPVAHISGGEETLGAIDNYYRHALTIMSQYHFTNTKKNAERVKQIRGSARHVYHTGSMGIDNINNTRLLSTKKFSKQFGFDITQPFILFTFHPETVNYKQNTAYAKAIEDILSNLSTNVLVTMPNADTMGNTIREHLKRAAAKNKRLHMVESLGSQGYYTALKNCILVLGNSSSGIVEAASFAKYVINMGDRQKGRERGKNIIDVKVSEKEVLSAIKKVHKLPALSTKNIYGDGKAAARIVSVLTKVKSR